MQDRRSRLKQAELASGLGAGVLGAGLGVLLASWLRPHVAAVLAVGAILHGWGMVDKHRLERVGGAPAIWWHSVLYWICWLALGALAVYIVATS